MSWVLLLVSLSTQLKGILARKTRHGSILEPVQDQHDLGQSLPWLSELVAGKFDIWAERNLAVVSGDGARRRYANWLVEYAEKWLRDASEIEPSGLPTETVLVELRIRLVERVEYWKGEAARHLNQREAQACAAKRAQPASASVCARHIDSWSFKRLSTRG